VEWVSSEYLTHLIATYGYAAIALIIGLESMGLPLPGESALVLAALYASRHDQNISGVVAAAATGAILGDNIGY
jgi:membrane protein DedA with SNARE-associated domain